MSAEETTPEAEPVIGPSRAAAGFLDGHDPAPASNVDMSMFEEPAAAEGFLPADKPTVPEAEELQEDSADDAEFTKRLVMERTQELLDRRHAEERGALLNGLADYHSGARDPAEIADDLVARFGVGVAAEFARAWHGDEVPERLPMSAAEWIGSMRQQVAEEQAIQQAIRQHEEQQAALQRADEHAEELQERYPDIRKRDFYATLMHLAGQAPEEVRATPDGARALVEGAYLADREAERAAREAALAVEFAEAEKVRDIWGELPEPPSFEQEYRKRFDWGNVRRRPSVAEKAEQWRSEVMETHPAGAEFDAFRANDLTRHGRGRKRP